MFRHETTMKAMPSFNSRPRPHYCLLLLSLLLPWSAPAFEGWEHETTSVLSLLVANHHVARVHGNDAALAGRLRHARDITDEFIHGLQRDGKATPVTFGRIVMLVDFFRDPYRMTHPARTGSFWPSNAATCNLAYLETLSRDSFAMYGASHANFDHFQGRALFAFWFWHKQAVQLAREDNLFAGLMLEAYANHFLEDAFAPGHLLAPRDDTDHDMFTLTLHDFYNERGLTYLVGEPSQLADVARSLQAALANGPLTAATKKGVTPKQLTLTLSSANAFVEALTSKPARIKCHGDANIARNPAQLPLVVTYCARAISDVVESYLSQKMVNSFETYRWEVKFFPLQFQPRVEALDFHLSYGGLTAEDNPRTMNTNDFLYQPTSVDPLAGMRLSYPITETIGPDALRNRASGFSVGLQTVVVNDRSDLDTHVRGFWEAGAVLWGRRYDQARPDWDVPRWYPDQIALAAGYSGVADTQEQGHGFFGRVLVPWPQINAEISLIAGMRYHSGYSGSGLEGGWGDFETVRVEWGMHLASLFLGIGHDHYPTRDSLADGFVIETGFTITFPSSRWKRMVLPK